MADNYYSRKENTLKLKILVIILWLAFVGAVLTGIVFAVNTILDENTQSGEVQISGEEAQNANKNLLVLIEDTVNRNIPPFFFIVGLDTAGDTLSVFTLPQTTRVSQQQSPGTVLSVYEYGGMSFLAGKIAEHYEIELNAYIGASLQEVETVVDRLGGIDFEVDRQMRQRNEAGTLVTNLTRGRQRLNGNQFCQFLRFNNWRNDEEKHSRRADLVVTLLSENFSTIPTDNVMSIYRSIVNATGTNVSIIMVYDFLRDIDRFRTPETNVRRAESAAALRSASQ